MTKQVKAYSHRQFWRLQEKELKDSEIKSPKQKEVIIEGYGRVKEQIITYKKRQYSTVVYRDAKGKFTKKPQSKLKEKEDFHDGILKGSKYYRASVFVEIPYHEKYYWFGVIVIDEKEKIDIKEMKEDVIKLLEERYPHGLGYRKEEFWFDLTWSIEYPAPYHATRPDKQFERWSKTKK